MWSEAILQQPEGKQLEFKRDLSSPHGAMKTLVAFANTAGGKLIIGIANNGKILGVENPLDEEERLCNLISDSISPRLVPSIELTTINNKTLLIVEVYLSNTRPHWLTTLGQQQGVMVRVGSSTRQAGRELIADLQRQVAGEAYDATPMPELSLESLDLNAMQQQFGATVQINEETLQTLNLLVKHQGRLVPSKGAILLFGKQRTRYFNDAWIQCGRFRGADKVDILDQTEIHEHLPQTVNSIELFLKKHAFKTAEFTGMRRTDHWSIPLTMLREVIINALVHADYSQRGIPMRVAFYDDRIEIESAGLLLPGLTVDDIKSGISMIRNPVIARVFRELGFIEQWGSGIKRIFSEAQKLGLPEPTIEEIAMRVRFTIPLVISTALQKASSPGVESGVESEMAQQIIELLVAGPLSKTDIAQALGKEKPSRHLNELMKKMLQLGEVTYTIPEKPNSRLQKYRLTNKVLSQQYNKKL